ncbi:MAG: phosphatidylglycerol lysyltransferase domain-containing protein [Bifidobacteriaceae bacterium]|jgi:lysyl-tRNA synthetase class 2|nr:phosphatidylglycerol lysyltransferase domain-containing protein [Bifidobacteriaceae bacterium]
MGQPKAAGDPVGAARRLLRARSWTARIVMVLAALGAISAVSTHLRHHMGWWGEVVPVVGPWSSSAALFMASALLFLLARGLYGGHRLNWLAATAILVFQAVLQAVRGEHHWVMAAGMLLAGVWLLTQWRVFPVLPTRRSVRLAAIGVSLCALATAAEVFTAARWLAGDRQAGGILGRAELWANRLALIIAVVVVVAVLWLLSSPRPAGVKSARAHLVERERARRVVDRYGVGSLDYFALRDDKSWFFVGHSVVAYSVRGGVCLVSPDPIGPVEERAATWAEFTLFVARHGWSLAVVAAAADWLEIYHSEGLKDFYIGDEAVVMVDSFTLEGHEHKSMRGAYNRVHRAGYTTVFVDPATVAQQDPALKAAVEEMVGESRRGEAERGFSMTLSRMFDPADTGLLLSVTRNPDGRVDALCQWVPAKALNGWSLDVMRRRIEEGLDLPNGLLEFTIIETIEELRRRGQKALTLNFAAFRETITGERSPAVGAVVRPVLGKVEKHVNLVGGLTSFNDRFDPQWCNRFLVTDRLENALPHALAYLGAEGISEVPLLGRFATGVLGPGAEAAAMEAETPEELAALEAEAVVAVGAAVPNSAAVPDGVPSPGDVAAAVPDGVVGPA